MSRAWWCSGHSIRFAIDRRGLDSPDESCRRLLIKYLHFLGLGLSTDSLEKKLTGLLTVSLGEAFNRSFPSLYFTYRGGLGEVRNRKQVMN